MITIRPADKFITRMKRPTGNGYYVRLRYGPKKMIRRYFSTREYDGWRRAHRVARRFRDARVRQHGLPPSVHGIRLANSANRAGCVGVSRTVRMRTATNRRGQKVRRAYPFWQAQIQTAKNHTRRKRFSVSRWGEKGAYRRAVSQRKDWERALKYQATQKGKKKPAD